MGAGRDQAVRLRAPRLHPARPRSRVRVMRRRAAAGVRGRKPGAEMSIRVFA